MPLPRRPDTRPPYRQIVSELERRIATGKLKPGARLPSTRRIARDWGVALATATKALTVLQHAGAIHAVARVGNVVADKTPQPSAASVLAPAAADDVTRDRIARVAIEIADLEGLAALSMRSVAAKLELPTMSLYRHVRSKQDLVLLMTDTAFGEQRYPAQIPTGWRAQLELAARLQWSLYRRHAWLAQVLTLTRPLALPNVIAHAEWALRALSGLGLDAATMLQVHMIMYSYVRSIAMNLESETQAEAETGVSEREWQDSQSQALNALTRSGELPTFAKLLVELSDGYDLDLDKLFEFGLQPLLDGLAGMFERRGG